MSIFKKNTEKHSNKLPMTGKVRRASDLTAPRLWVQRLSRHLGHGIRCQ